MTGDQWLLFRRFRLQRKQRGHLWCNRRVISVRLGIVVLLAAVPLRAQNVAAQPTQGAARTLLAAVVSAQGRPVVDVGVDEFVVTEGGLPRDVLELHIADYPLALVLDDRPEVAGGLGAVRAAARRFIQRVGERPVALLRLSDGHQPVATLDDGRLVALERLASITSGGSDGSAPLDTIARAGALLKESGAPFSAVIVIAAAPVDATALVRGELLPAILDSGAAVHVVQAQPSGAATPDTPGTPDLLRLLADETRGQFTAIFSSASYDAALDRLADRLAIELMVQYLVPAGPSGGDVRVGVRVPGARVVGLGAR